MSRTELSQKIKPPNVSAVAETPKVLKLSSLFFLNPPVDLDRNNLKKWEIKFHIAEVKMQIAVVLAVHGVPSKDFPKEEMMELFGLHPRLAQVSGAERESLQKRHDELEKKMRQWPRTPENDPYFCASFEIARKMEEILGEKVFVGFNEFCAPTIEEAIGEAAQSRPDKIIVLTPMMTRGGEHSERDIPRAIQKARKLHQDLDIVYAWPFDVSYVAAFLAGHIKHFQKREDRK
jgi:sirohydrochlorin cobaltochelatase